MLLRPHAPLGAVRVNKKNKIKSKLSNWLITKDTDNMNQSKLQAFNHVADAKRAKMCESDSQSVS